MQRRSSSRQPVALDVDVERRPEWMEERRAVESAGVQPSDGLRPTALTVPLFLLPSCRSVAAANRAKSNLTRAEATRCNQALQTRNGKLEHDEPEKRGRRKEQQGVAQESAQASQASTTYEG
jgi:hypothetical protein